MTDKEDKETKEAAFLEHILNEEPAFLNWVLKRHGLKEVTAAEYRKAPDSSSTDTPVK